MIMIYDMYDKVTHTKKTPYTEESILQIAKTVGISDEQVQYDKETESCHITCNNQKEIAKLFANKFISNKIIVCITETGITLVKNKEV